MRVDEGRNGRGLLAIDTEGAYRGEGEEPASWPSIRVMASEGEEEMASAKIINGKSKEAKNEEADNCSSHHIAISTQQCRNGTP